MKKIDFSDRMEAEKYFCGVVEQMRGVKVKAVFSCCPSFGDYDGIRRYIEDIDGMHPAQTYFHLARY